MFRRVIVLSVLLMLMAAGILLTNPVLVGEPSWFATPPIAPPHTSINLELWNTSLDTIKIHNSAPWWIENSDNVTVATPGFTCQAIFKIPPGGVAPYPWLWSQTDDNGIQVPPGDYTAHVCWRYNSESDEDPCHESVCHITILGGVVWKADSTISTEGDPIALKFKNLTDDPLELRITGSRIYDKWNDDMSSWVPVLSEPNMGDVIASGDSIEFLEDTSALNGPGDYRVRLEYHGDGSPYYADEFFKIIDSAGDSIYWYAIPRTNTTNSIISLSITNASDDTIYLPDSAPWEITDPDTNHVYGPVRTFAIIPFPPGATMSWGWREIYDDGTPVPEGEYLAFVKYYPDDSYSHTEELSVEILLINPEKSPYYPMCEWVRTDSLSYEEGSTVSFTFTNCAPDTVVQHAQYCWWIGNAIGFPVHIPIVLMANKEFAPQESIVPWCWWDQTDMDDPPKQVPPGIYYVFFTFTDKFWVTHYVVASRPFLIGSTQTDTGDLTPLAGNLKQNYPNPFNPSTTIRYDIAEKGHVSLRIYDVSGRLIRVLVDEIQGPSGGQYEVTWDGKDEAGRTASSGVYFYRLVSGKTELSRKMILLK